MLLSSADVAAAHRLMKVLAQGSEADPFQIVPGDRPHTVTREALIEAAWQEFERRGRRMQLLPKEMFGEPAWEMLLNSLRRAATHSPDYCSPVGQVGPASSTALRWLNYLEDRRLVVREPHPTDLRSADSQAHIERN